MSDDYNYVPDPTMRQLKRTNDDVLRDLHAVTEEARKLHAWALEAGELIASLQAIIEALTGHDITTSTGTRDLLAEVEAIKEDAPDQLTLEDPQA